MPKIKAQEKPKESSYGAKDIYVLEGLDPVRKRPGMYIGSTGPEGLHHLIWECVDNSLDEAMAGYAKNIEVELMPGNRIRTTDDGRGIPVEKHPQTHKSTLETVVTTLHAGGKFGGEAYKVSGGLHGVGVSVVCALSVFMKAEICRDGKRYAQEYAKGKVKTPVKVVGACKATGTTIIFEPDTEIFKDSKFDLKKIYTHLRQQAYLTPGVRITIIDSREAVPQTYAFCFAGGIKSYIKYLVHGIVPIQQNIFYTSAEKEKVFVEAAFQYTQEQEFYEESFANNINTGEGGTHITGFRTALTRSLNDYARKNNFLKENEDNLSGEDVRDGFTGVVSVKIREPQFEGQTKAKLGNPEAKTAVEAAVGEGLTDFLERNPQDARSIIEKCLLAAKARKAAKAARQTVLRKGVLDGLALPGKLADCSSKEPEESELFIVEGDSAGGSCKMGRDRRFQAILPLRGKILNIEKARLDKILANKEVKSLIIALGTAIAEDFNIENLRYHRIILTLDADVDGSHIRTLLLTLFYRYFQSIIEKGHLYIAQPPLYRIQSGKRLEYAYTDADKTEILDSMKKEGKANPSIQRYKGLGEMNPEQLWETTMDPKNRILLQVNIEDAREADRVFDMLMGDDVLPRKKFIQAHAQKVKNLDI
jgi:DNA gyrase subunit B